MIESILNLLFPNLCVFCNTSLVESERHLCLNCQLKLPETFDHLKIENGVEKTFWGRIPFERAFSFLFFNQRGLTQKILHELKYNGNENLAVFLGELYAKRIEKTIQCHGIDSVIAVPLHPSKMRKRGYNQSLAFATGISNTLNLENFSNNVIRKIATDTQTKKNRTERWKNVDQVFEITDRNLFEKKHILVIDDVITTGATLESCANEIVKCGNCRISIASIAYAA